MTNDEPEDLDENDEAVTAEANCELRELPQKIENEMPIEEHVLQGDSDKIDNIKVIDPPQT